MSTKRKHAIEEVCKNHMTHQFFKASGHQGLLIEKKFFRGLCVQYFGPRLVFVWSGGDILHTYKSKFRNVHMCASRGFDIRRDLPLFATSLLNMALSNCYGIFDRNYVCCCPLPLNQNNLVHKIH